MNQENRYLLKFAWKNISRHKGRSFFIGFSVALSVCIAVWVMAFFDGLNHQIEEAVVNTNTGFYQFQEINYSKTTDSETPRVFTQKIDEELKKVSVVQSYSPELLLDGNIATPEGAAAISILGIVPRYHQKFLPLNSYLVEGQFISETEPNEIMIGEELASIFKFKAGDQLVLNYQDVNGELRSELLSINGIFKYNSKSFEKRFAYINQSTWQNLFFGETKGPILFHRITVMTNGLNYNLDLKDIAQRNELELRTWKNLNPEMAVVIDFHDGMISFFFSIIAITITMTILTPVRMLWQERMKEMKMMTVLGIPHKGLWKLGFFEVFWMTILSASGAIAILFILISIQSYTGIDFSFMNNGIAVERAGIQLPTIVYPRATLNQILMTLGFVVMTIVFSYTWSIHRTLKKLDSAI
ncbi:MAG: ABC transporter permease [Bacteriovoracaceae bacterium]